MSYTSLVVDWIATIFLLIEQKEREIRVLYSKGFKLKKEVAKAGEELDNAKELQAQNKTTEDEVFKIFLKYIGAREALGDFISNELPGKGKKIQLQIDSLIKNLNRLTKLKQKLDDKLKSQKSKNKTERHTNENVRTKNS